MKHNQGFFSSYLTLNVILVLLLIVNTVILAFVSKTLVVVSALITLIAVGMVIFRVVNIQKSYKAFLNALESNASIRSKALVNFKIPVIITDKCREVLWYNEAFSKYLTDGDCYGADIVELFSLNEEKLQKDGLCDIRFHKHEFSVFCTDIVETDAEFMIYYLTDNTALKRAAREYKLSRPVVMLLTMDNFNEALHGCRDSERSSFRSSVHKAIETWLADVPGISLNVSDNRVLVVMEERHLEKLIEGKFPVLDAVRRLKIHDVGGVTLSIGIGCGAGTMYGCETLCLQALEMAQSRGGDQVAIKSVGNDYRFFGGVSNAVERRTKVRARVVASALYEMIAASSKVLFMGHRFSDLDCLGAAYGMSTVASALKKPCYLVFDPQKTLALPLFKRITAQDHNCIFTGGNDLDDLIDDHTLLIILDVHRPDFVENPALYKKVRNVVVIDHHRKAVDAISNAVIFYHETAASSACEMVTELIQYMDVPTPSPLAADALLSGIMLDTKNLCLHTGVRTFEASAYLRSCNADPVRVKKLFSDNMRTYKRKSDIVGRAQLFMNCAVSYDDTSDDITRIATSQAADELLNLENVLASFVLCRMGEEINISARSLGEVNVQLIMEALGGGGHSNMAACQLKTSDFDAAKQTLLQAIKEYNENYSERSVLE